MNDGDKMKPDIDKDSDVRDNPVKNNPKDAQSGTSNASRQSGSGKTSSDCGCG